MDIIAQLEAEQAKKLNPTVPEFGPGDTVIVNVKVKEGERTRVQAYEGVCIGRSGGDRKSTRLNSSHIPLSRMPSSA